MVRRNGKFINAKTALQSASFGYAVDNYAVGFKRFSSVKIKT